MRTLSGSRLDVRRSGPGRNRRSRRLQSSPPFLTSNEDRRANFSTDLGLAILMVGLALAFGPVTTFPRGPGRPAQTQGR